MTLPQLMELENYFFSSNLLEYRRISQNITTLFVYSYPAKLHQLLGTPTEATSTSTPQPQRQNQI